MCNNPKDGGGGGHCVIGGDEVEDISLRDGGGGEGDLERKKYLQKDRGEGSEGVH